MKRVFALEEPPITFDSSIFLAGPTPRSQAVASWRPAAIELLGQMGYDGVVFIPESRDGVWHREWEAQVEWERRYLAAAHCILFWVPRSMPDMPALTTNAEWGAWQNSGKVVLGFPPESAHNRYLAHYATDGKIPVAATLPETIQNAFALMEQNVRPNCVFCRIVRSDELRQIEWRGTDSIVIAPHHPVVSGHRLVIPRIHARDALANPDITQRVMADAARYATEMALEQLNVITSVGEDATQTVFHLHVHLVPRVKGDGLHLPWTNQSRE